MARIDSSKTGANGGRYISSLADWFVTKCSTCHLDTGRSYVPERLPSLERDRLPFLPDLLNEGRIEATHSSDDSLAAIELVVLQFAALIAPPRLLGYGCEHDRPAALNVVRGLKSRLTLTDFRDILCLVRHFSAVVQGAVGMKSAIKESHRVPAAQKI